MSEALVAGLVGLMVGMFKLIEWLVKQRTGREGRTAKDQEKHEAHELQQLLPIIPMVQDLHTWHAVEDPETGAKRWFVPAGLVQRLVEVENRQRECCSGMVEQVKMLREECKRLTELLDANADLHNKQITELYERVIATLATFGQRIEHGLVAFERTEEEGSHD